MPFAGKVCFMLDPVAQSDTRVAGEFSTVRVDQLPSYPTAPLGPASTDETNQRRQKKERT